MFNYLKEKNLKKAYSKSISFKFQKKIIYLVPIGNWILKNNKIIKSINKYRSIHNKCFIRNKNTIFKMNFVLCLLFIIPTFCSIAFSIVHQRHFYSSFKNNINFTTYFFKTISNYS